MSEPRILINGVQLTNAQAMTIRVGIEHFAHNLHHDGLGDDDHGKAMVKGYTARIDEIREIIFNRRT